jgi:hypothetical protein
MRNSYKPQVYFCDLNPNTIINLDQPCHYEEFHWLPGYLETGTKQTFDVVNKLYFEEMEHTTAHWSSLLDHIKRWGVLYPVIVTTGLPKSRSLKSIPKEYWATDSKFWITCEQQGGTRILAAQQLGIKVPALVNDHVGLFQDQMPISMRDLKEICTNVDKIVLSPNRGVEIKCFPRLHLDIDDCVYDACKKEAIDIVIKQHLLK